MDILVAGSRLGWKIGDMVSFLISSRHISSQQFETSLDHFLQHFPYLLVIHTQPYYKK